LGRRVDGRSRKVAQKGNRVSLDETSQAVWSRLIVDRQIKERHHPDVLANTRFDFLFEEPHVGRSRLAHTPARTIDLPFFNHCRTNK
jgi:hypothetical protein